jgi:hypothetical protein
LQGYDHLFEAFFANGKISTNKPTSTSQKIGNQPLMNSAHHMDIDEKKVKLFCNILNIELKDRLVLFPDLCYNALASVAIDQEGTFRDCAEAEEKNRKRAMPEPSGGGSGMLHHKKVTRRNAVGRDL